MSKLHTLKHLALITWIIYATVACQKSSYEKEHSSALQYWSEIELKGVTLDPQQVYSVTEPFISVAGVKFLEKRLESNDQMESFSATMTILSINDSLSTGNSRKAELIRQCIRSTPVMIKASEFKSTSKNPRIRLMLEGILQSSQSNSIPVR